MVAPEVGRREDLPASPVDMAAQKRGESMGEIFQRKETVVTAQERLLGGGSPGMGFSGDKTKVQTCVEDSGFG